MSLSITPKWILVFSLLSCPAFASSCLDESTSFSGTCFDVATNYSMTMKGFRLRMVDNVGTPIGFVTVSDTTSTYNFAAIDAGSSLANYISGAEVPAGTYDAVSPILDTNIIVAGSTTLDGNSDFSCSTDGNINFDLTSEETGFTSGSDGVEGLSDYDDSCGSSNEGEGCGNNYIDGDGNFVIIDSAVTGFPVTIEDGDSLSFVMTIDIAETVNYEWNSGACISQSPGELFVSMAGIVN